MTPHSSSSTLSARTGAGGSAGHRADGAPGGTPAAAPAPTPGGVAAVIPGRVGAASPIDPLRDAIVTAAQSAFQTAAQAAAKLAVDAAQQVVAQVIASITGSHTDIDGNGSGSGTSSGGSGGGGATSVTPGVTGSAAVEIVVNRALSQLGVPYSWGGGNASGPTKGIRDGGVADSYGDYNKVGFDCSGLMIYAFAGIGISLPHYTGYQYTSGPHVPLSQMQRGDMIFYGANASQHVALYLGNNRWWRHRSRVGREDLAPAHERRDAVRRPTHRVDAGGAPAVPGRAAERPLPSGATGVRGLPDATEAEQARRPVEENA